MKHNVERLTNVSSLDKFSETQLPPKSECYSKLNDEDISDEDYQHAQNVWSTFNCKTINKLSRSLSQI